MERWITNALKYEVVDLKMIDVCHSKEGGAEHNVFRF